MNPSARFWTWWRARGAGTFRPTVETFAATALRIGVALRPPAIATRMAPRRLFAAIALRPPAIAVSGMEPTALRIGVALPSPHIRGRLAPTALRAAVALRPPMLGGSAPGAFTVAYGLANTAGAPVGAGLEAQAAGPTFNLDFPANTAAAPRWYFTLPAGRTVTAIRNIALGAPGFDDFADWSQAPGTQRWYFSSTPFREGTGYHIQVDTDAV